MTRGTFAALMLSTGSLAAGIMSMSGFAWWGLLIGQVLIFAVGGWLGPYVKKPEKKASANEGESWT